MRRLLSFALVAVFAFAVDVSANAFQGKNSVGDGRVNGDGKVRVDSLGFPTHTAAGTKQQYYRDTLTAAGRDTSLAFNINGLAGLSATFLPVKLVLATNVTVTPLVSDDGVYWQALTSFTHAHSHTAAQTYASGSSAARVTMLAPGLDSLVTPIVTAGNEVVPHMTASQQALLRTASRLRFDVNLATHGGTDSTIYKIIVRRQNPH